jgi:hypothetical protein
LKDEENRKLKDVEEGNGNINIKENSKVSEEMVDEEKKNVELRKKKRMDYVGND